MKYADIQIAGNHPAFAGHFPGTPIVPGALLLDEVLNAIAASEGIAAERCKIPSEKFKRMVGPGEPLILGFEFTGPGAVRFELRSAADVVADGMVLFR